MRDIIRDISGDISGDVIQSQTNFSPGIECHSQSQNQPEWGFKLFQSQHSADGDSTG